MRNKILSNTEAIFDLYAPTQDKFIGILSIPHSGEIEPEIFKEYLTTNERHRIEDVDTRVDALVDIKALQDAGIFVIVSKIQRVCVDLNRAPDICVLNWKENSMGETLVIKEIDSKLEKDLISKYHTPYFETLKSLIYGLGTKSSKVSFIDLHSMPSKPTAYHLKVTPDQDKVRPDFCVSNISGKSAEEDFMNFVCDELTKTYERVNQNAPYYGGHITRHIDSLFPDINNIQIEIRRDNYMDEVSKELIQEKVDKMKPILTEMLIKTFEKFYNKYQRTA